MTFNAWSSRLTYIAKILKDRDLTRQVGALVLDAERGRGMIEGLQAAAAA